ncbi:hypothetical protein BDZ90DRAFT_231792 [Jaminaea rosea]|uniref:Uncharacterized protein n=1 Tax=Jaminaea rosea TaxID=1569628 RepID=A0A316URW0_9BASI|nr:hypothetical protein BDZ90DRAFT_231792 [Jaminaea rosea]PWN28026.1 hypothetical protein BDZ90DRAFT_231792 [Jaminaea rosea]
MVANDAGQFASPMAPSSARQVNGSDPATAAAAQSPVVDLATAIKLLSAVNMERGLLIAGASALRRLRNDILGVEAIQNLILAGHSPEAIKYCLAQSSVMREQIQAKLPDLVGNFALGYAISTTSSQLKAAIATSNNSPKQTIEIILKTIDEARKTKPAPYQPADEVIDYAPLIQFVDYQRVEGVLFEDPAWADGRKAKDRWDARLSHTIKDMNLRFNDAVAALDWKQAGLNVTLILQAAQPSDALSIVNNSGTAQVVAGPSLPSKAAAAPDLLGVSDKTLAAHGRVVRQALVRTLLERAEAHSSISISTIEEGCLRSTINDKNIRTLGTVNGTTATATTRNGNGHTPHEASGEDERLWHALLQAVGIKSEWALAWGAALLSLDRNEEAIQAFSIAITTCGQQQASLSDSSSYTEPLSRSRDVTLDELIAQLTISHDDDESTSDDEVEENGEHKATGYSIPAQAISKEERRLAHVIFRAALLLRALARVRLLSIAHDDQAGGVSSSGTVSIPESVITSSNSNLRGSSARVGDEATNGIRSSSSSSSNHDEGSVNDTVSTCESVTTLASSVEQPADKAFAPASSLANGKVGGANSMDSSSSELVRLASLDLERLVKIQPGHKHAQALLDVLCGLEARTGKDSSSENGISKANGGDAATSAEEPDSKQIEMCETSSKNVEGAEPSPAGQGVNRVKVARVEDEEE